MNLLRRLNELNNKLKNVGLGILNWKCYETLRASLESHKRGGLLELFDEKIIFFQEIDDEARAIAKQYGFQAHGTPENLGIYGGFKGLAKNMQSKYVLLLENDQPLIENLKTAKQQLENGLQFLQEKRADVVQYRSLHFPSNEPANTRHFQRFFPPENSPLWQRIFACTRRLFHPRGANRRIGDTPFFIEFPEKKFPQIMRDKQTNFLIMSSKYRKWSNQPFLINNSFFKNTLLSYVENARTKRRVNNFKTIEIELNNVWWDRQNFIVAMAPGIFTHHRIGKKGF